MAAAAVGRAELYGQKRRADDELEGEQPLTKKFGRLRIGRYSNPADTTKPIATTTSHVSVLPEAPRVSPFDGDGDGMQVDDTKTRVYINDLEREIAEIEAEERNHVVEFLPEIEKKLMAIPESVLNYKPDNELVLYRLPRVLSISEEEDATRSVIADARERAREKSLADLRKKEQEGKAMTIDADGHGIHMPQLEIFGTIPPQQASVPPYDDVDAMEIDD
ncbi:hypothetical protein PRK78_004002 [Emydomyces testavorans]|uniref:Uncharacterized protein n=1 Tax=Emydomyces testavorans TaxID=2070801 RepID=A0AAF0DHX7_9EURO|nr:hypothetical protein PRK78_004002 [Emydomyces testavorans]